LPTSIDPQPGENEFECANCGAYVHYELTRCPNCGINLYEPEDEDRSPDATSTSSPIRQTFNPFKQVSRLISSLLGHSKEAEEFESLLSKQATLFADLLRKVGGDYDVAGRLIDHEARLLPNASRTTWIQDAIQRWQRDNRSWK
jgi:hypothetical protein